MSLRSDRFTVWSGLLFFEQNMDCSALAVQSAFSLERAAAFFFVSLGPHPFGSSQARGGIRAVAVSLRHSHSSPGSVGYICDLHHSS